MKMDGDASLARALEMMQRLSDDGDMNSSKLSAASAMESVSDDVLGTMMKEFEQMGKKEDFGAAVDNVMRQLLDKSVMYIPMKQICEMVNMKARHLYTVTCSDRA